MIKLKLVKSDNVKAFKPKDYVVINSADKVFVPDILKTNFVLAVDYTKEKSIMLYDLKWYFETELQSYDDWRLANPDW